MSNVQSLSAERDGVKPNSLMEHGEGDPGRRPEFFGELEVVADGSVSKVEIMRIDEGDLNRRASYRICLWEGKGREAEVGKLVSGISNSAAQLNPEVVEEKVGDVGLSGGDTNAAHEYVGYVGNGATGWAWSGLNIVS